MQVADRGGEHQDVARRLEVAQDQLPRRGVLGVVAASGVYQAHRVTTSRGNPRLDAPPPPELEELPFELLLLELEPPFELLLELLGLLELLDELLERLEELDDDEGLDELELLGAGEVELDDAAGAAELDGEVGPVGDPPVVQPASTPAPAKAMPPESSFRNSRRS